MGLRAPFGAGPISSKLAPFLQPRGFDIFCLGKKFLVFNLVSRNLKVKYRRSVLGVFWTLLSPMAMAAVYFFVFKVVLKVQIPYYLAFILSGVLPWSFFAQTVGEGMEAIVGNWGLISKVPVPLQIFPYVGALTNLVTLSLSIPIIIGAAVISGVHLGPSLILLPLYVLILFTMAYAFSLLLSVAFVYFRDLRHLLSLLIQIWFYATPVLYSEEMLRGRAEFILYLNPLAFVFVGLHTILVRGAWPSVEAISTSLVWVSVMVAVVILYQERLFKNLVEKV